MRTCVNVASYAAGYIPQVGSIISSALNTVVNSSKTWHALQIATGAQRGAIRTQFVKNEVANWGACTILGRIPGGHTLAENALNTNFSFVSGKALQNNLPFHAQGLANTVKTLALNSNPWHADSPNVGGVYLAQAAEVIGDLAGIPGLG